MDLSGETKDESARTSPSGEADDDDKELRKQRAGSGDEDDDEGTRQPYKCTFCRRGFPTAQALGGHMNVHRRHRGRSSAATTGGAAAQGSSSSSNSCYEQQPYYSTTTPVVAFGQTHPASGTSVAALSHAERQQPSELHLFGRDCAAAGRGKEGGTGDVRRDRCYEKDGDATGDHGGGEVLDLELRLGGAGS